MTARIGAAIKAARKTDPRYRFGDDLVNALAARGVEMSRNTLANLESGRRDTISIGELFAIASVLDVAPAALLFADPQADVQVLPDVEPIPGHWVLEWIVGAGERLPVALLSDLTDDAEHRYRASCAALRACRTHDDLALDVLLTGAETPHDPDCTDADLARYRRAVQRLAEHRDDMRQHGWTLPELLGDGAVDRALAAVTGARTTTASTPTDTEET